MTASDEQKILPPVVSCHAAVRSPRTAEPAPHQHQNKKGKHQHQQRQQQQRRFPPAPMVQRKDQLSVGAPWPQRHSTASGPQSVR